MALSGFRRGAPGSGVTPEDISPAGTEGLDGRIIALSASGSDGKLSRLGGVPPAPIKYAMICVYISLPRLPGLVGGIIKDMYVNKLSADFPPHLL
jgi:hypothetical protein